MCDAPRRHASPLITSPSRSYLRLARISWQWRVQGTIGEAEQAPHPKLAHHTAHACPHSLEATSPAASMPHVDRPSHHLHHCISTQQLHCPLLNNATRHSTELDLSTCPSRHLLFCSTSPFSALHLPLPSCYPPPLIGRGRAAYAVSRNYLAA
jgi:hypothetical protein